MTNALVSGRYDALFLLLIATVCLINPITSLLHKLLHLLHKLLFYQASHFQEEQSQTAKSGIRRKLNHIFLLEKYIS